MLLVAAVHWYAWSADQFASLTQFPAERRHTDACESCLQKKKNTMKRILRLLEWKAFGLHATVATVKSIFSGFRNFLLKLYVCQLVSAK